MTHHHRQTTSSLGSGPSLDGRIRKGQFDVDLNMGDVTVISSYDDQSRVGGSSAHSLPPDVHEERMRKVRQLQRRHQYEQEQQREQATGRSEGKRSSQHDQSDHESQQSPPPPKESLLKSISRRNPLRHYSLLVLAHVFFLIGSGLFIGASWFEYNEASNNHRSSTFLTKDRDSESDEERSGYHLKLSTSIDTYVTKQMIFLLGATFCFLQVGFINVVRTPLDKFHFFQILAGLFGLVSAMFWETKTVLSDICYFFFVHAMTGQALLLMHSHWRRLVRPAIAELKIERDAQQEHQQQQQQQQDHRPSNRFTLSPLRQQDGHFAFDSSRNLYENPSGLMSDDQDETDHGDPSSTEEKSSDGGYSFSIENSYSMEELESFPDQSLREEDRREFQRQTEDLSEEESQSHSDATKVRRNADIDETKEETKEESIMLKFGFISCFGDSIFVLGSLIETALTYLTILVLPGQDENDGGNFWNEVARVLNLVPGILWLVYACLTLLTTLWFRKQTSVPRSNLRFPSV